MHWIIWPYLIIGKTNAGLSYNINNTISDGTDVNYPAWFLL